METINLAKSYFLEFTSLSRVHTKRVGVVQFKALMLASTRELRLTHGVNGALELCFKRQLFEVETNVTQK